MYMYCEYGTFRLGLEWKLKSYLGILLICITGVAHHQSTTSETSCDYADPPDDTTSRSDSDTSEPEQKLLKYTDESSKLVRPLHL